MNRPRERRHRLPGDYYTGCGAVAFTACVFDRFPLFTDPAVVRPIETCLLDAITELEGEALVYLFMPDHLHLLLGSYGDQADLLAIMKQFKQRSGFWLSRNRPGIRWQKDFYDHILRAEEDILKQVRYILANPVRSGMVEHWKAYPFKGSTVYDLEQWDDGAI